MMAAGSSQRGLSEVTMATSASSAAVAPIAGRLVAYAVTAATEHDEDTVVADGLAGGGEHLGQAVGRVGVVDDDRERLAGVDRFEAARHRRRSGQARRDGGVVDA